MWRPSLNDRASATFPAVNACKNCGAALQIDGDRAVTCKFCETANAAPPKEVQVPVPVQLVHQVVQVMGAHGAAVRELKCPECAKRLVAARVEDVELHGCGGCGGIWVDNASARKIVAWPQRSYAELARRAGENARGARTRRQGPWVGGYSSPPPPLECPVCDARLDETRFLHLALDICPDHGTWFDAYELKGMVERLLNPLGPEPPPTGPVVCTGCGCEIQRVSANVTGDGWQCDACWRGFQLKQITQAEQTRGAAAAGGLLAFGLAVAVAGATAGSPRNR